MTNRTLIDSNVLDISIDSSGSQVESFDWEVKDISQEDMTIQLNFENAVAISGLSVRDTLEIRVLDNEYFWAE